MKQSSAPFEAFASRPFSNASNVAGYAERTARVVPGLHDLHTMAGVLVDERTDPNARVLVLGAGGGLELKAFAESYPNWHFDGVDPSAEMLQLARATLGPLASRVCFHEGYVDTAPEGPFDAATCLLVLHFLSIDARRHTLAQLHQRLRPGAPLIVAHHSFPNKGGDADRWLTRYAAYATAAGMPDVNTANSIATMKAKLPVLAPKQDEALLHEAGFSDVELFYCGLTFKGWVAVRR